MTLMLSENLEIYTSTAGTQGSKTHSWQDCPSLTSTSSSCVSFAYGATSSTTTPGIINSYTYPPTFNDNLESAHGGGAIAAFCDGHVIFLRGDINASTTFEQLVNPINSVSGTAALLDESTYAMP